MGLQQIIESVNKSALKTDVPRMDIGDTVNVHCRIVEGDKERVQIFSGVIIGRAGRGTSEMLTVRRIVEDMGVERIFPVHSPKIAMFEVVRRGDVRRAKLYYLRERTGKARRLAERKRGLEQLKTEPGSPSGAAMPGPTAPSDEPTTPKPAKREKNAKA